MYSIKGGKASEDKHIDDRVLYQAFINTFNAMIENNGYFMAKWQENLKNENVLVRYKSGEFIKIIGRTEIECVIE